MKFKIGNRMLGEGEPCFIIAEAGVNHNGDVKLAMKLVDAAKASGADAVKFQTFKAEDLVIRDVPMAEYQQKNTGQKRSQIEMLKDLELEYRYFVEIKEYCDKAGIIFLSTPHTEDAMEFLDDLVPAYKVGSGDLNNMPFLQKIAGKAKPVILGTGMSTLQEVKDAVRTIHEHGNEEVVVLHCTTNYPCSIDEVNLRAMISLREELGCLAGYSDHTVGINIPVMAAALGAAVIEKHFTIDNSLPGPDHKASLDSEEFKKMVSAVRDTEKALGDGIKGPTLNEEKLKSIVRKSLVARLDIQQGSRISDEMLTVKRPGGGISPGEINDVIGRMAKKDIKKDEMISREVLDI